MNKVIDIIFKDIKKDKSIYISLIIVLVLSLLFGTFFLKILENNDKELVMTHINTYFDSIKNGSLKFNLYNNIINNNITLFILWILGFSVIGLPLVVGILFYKGFSLSFTVTSLIYNFKFNGIFFSLVYIFPHLILNILFYFVVSYYSFKLCLNIIQVILNKNKLNLSFLKKYIVVLLISIIFLSLSAAYETYILPYLIKIIY
jgi:stage II sporulation protein M